MSTTRAARAAELKARAAKDAELEALNDRFQQAADLPQAYEILIEASTWQMRQLVDLNHLSDVARGRDWLTTCLMTSRFGEDWATDYARLLREG